MRYTTAFRQLTPVGVCLLLALTATGCGTDSDEASSDETGEAPVSVESDSTTSDTADAEQGLTSDDGNAGTSTDDAAHDATSTSEPAEVTDAATDATADSQPVAVLAASDWLGDYRLVDEEFDTLTTVTVTETERTIVTNALPNHDTGEFPNSGNPNTISAQDNTWVFPTNATWTGTATWAMVPGVAVNGVKFEPETAETVECDSGERYRVEALQDTYDLGLDFNNAHVQPNGEYHYHGVSQLLAQAATSGDDLVHVGFAADGYLIYYSMSGVYSSSWTLSTEPRTGSGCIGSRAIGAAPVEIDGIQPDGTFVSDWTFDESLGDLDECNGIWIDDQYAYLITDEYPFVSRCLNGEVSGNNSTGAPPTGAPTGDAPADDTPAGTPTGQSPDFSDAAMALGVTVEELQAALPPPGEPLNDAAAALGVTVDELTAVLPPPPG